MQVRDDGVMSRDESSRGGNLEKFELGVYFEEIITGCTEGLGVREREVLRIFPSLAGATG